MQKVSKTQIQKPHKHIIQVNNDNWLPGSSEVQTAPVTILTVCCPTAQSSEIRAEIQAETML